MTVSFLPLSRCAYCQDCQFRFLLANNQQWNGDRPIGSLDNIRGICEAALIEIPAIVSINDVGAQNYILFHRSWVVFQNSSSVISLFHRRWASGTKS